VEHVEKPVHPLCVASRTSPVDEARDPQPRRQLFAERGEVEVARRRRRRNAKRCQRDLISLRKHQQTRHELLSAQ
jgi:hypothetical protein